MNRKIVKLALLTMLLLSLVTSAFASSVPSKTTSDMAAAGGYVSSTGAAISNSFAVQVVESARVSAELENIFAFVTETGAPPIEYFSDEIKAQIQALLPEGFALESLVLNEFVGIESIAYDPAYGDVSVAFEFATPYEDGQILVALVGVFDASGNVEWHVLEAVSENGKVIITFTVEILEMMDDSAVALAILSEA